MSNWSKILMYNVLCAICLMCSSSGCRESIEINQRGPVAIQNATEEVIYVACLVDRAKSFSTTEVILKEGIDGFTKLEPGGYFESQTYVNYTTPYLYQLNCHFLILTQNTIDKYSVRELMENNIYDDMLIFSIEEMAEMHFCVEYNGKID